MKKIIYSLGSALILSTAVFTGCSSPDSKMENAEQKVQDAKEDLRDAKQEVISEFQQFKNDAGVEIKNNEDQIAHLKIDIKNEKTEAREKDEKIIDDLDKRNRALKEKLEAYSDDGKSDWREFKKEFKHDLAGLGDAFKNIVVRNTK